MNNTRPDNNSSVTSSIHSIRTSNGASLSNFSSSGIAFEQQTFLGASIRSVNINAGYGDSASTLSVDLINDEYNVSDRTDLGLGDDVYHNGKSDRFTPPQVGSPVYFKIGPRRAPVDEAYKTIYDSIYNTNTSINSVGKNHICFGGILQSYVQNRGPGGNPLYSVQVVDPREILSNVEIILNNYAGTTLGQKNIFNVYGFLEYNLPDSVKNTFGTPNLFRKIVYPDGSYEFLGDDSYGTPEIGVGAFLYNMNINYAGQTFFPVTGTGFSRRGPQGIPFFKLAYGLNALLGTYGKLPQPYINAGFGSFINFRGFNYVLDVGGLPNLPPYYFVDYDQINLLDLCLEICDVSNRELFVSLLPIIENHPACGKLLQWNRTNPNQFIAGIIRVDSIDRSFQPAYGSIKRYIDSLTNQNIFVENQDVGFELTNIVTDKLVAGAQEVDMYCFSNNNDRDELTVRQKLSGTSENANELENQWRLNNSLKQQILPYYGLLGNRALTIPKGYGAYQQILLDASLLNANGVGNYYVATEMELRASLISYERWSEFLLSYNDIYMEDIDGEGNYQVTVPRCVFDSEDINYDVDDLPKSPCSPPFGYPLYYKRATKIGLQGAGLSDLYGRLNGIITSIAQLGGAPNKDEAQKILSNIWDDLNSQSFGDLTALEKELIAEIKKLKEDPKNIDKAALIGLVQKFEGGLSSGLRIMNRLSKKTKENSMKVYNFVRAVAEECLGKKFLVKIPKTVNMFYSEIIKSDDNFKYSEGPFGFKPRLTAFDTSPNGQFYDMRSQFDVKNHFFEIFLDENNTIGQDFVGALKVNFNPITDQYEYNYTPEPQGGYFGFDMAQVSGNQVIGVNYGLIPQDFTKFILNNSRISPYVRFNHSQNLSFNGIDSSSFVQQQKLGNYFIPDLSNQMDNTGDNKVFDLPENSEPPDPHAVAFVKCELDENFYMPPKRERDSDGKLKQGHNGLYDVKTHAVTATKLDKRNPPQKKFVCMSSVDSAGNTVSSGVWIDVPQPSGNIFFPEPSGDKKTESVIAKDHFFIRDSVGVIKTSLQDLDTNHVYALITLPGRISATKESRFRDSIVQEVNAVMLKHLLTMDVVRIPEFNAPTTITGFPTVVISGDVSLQVAYNIALEKTINYSLHNRLSFASPSPVYPDLVVIPLMSRERCYGPWNSKSIIDSGGKTEFIKDENLAPWNYAGYQLMNDAGVLKASGTGPVLTQSERGGFVTPNIPAGVFIGKFLENAGPLVTNISIDISEQGIKSTVKMDLYTVSFGKLQKQKEDAISSIGRERQKLTDERNALIRKGMAKNQTNVNYQLLYNNIKNISKSQGSLTLNSNIIGPSMTHLVAGVDINSDFADGDSMFEQSTSIQSVDQINDTANLMPNSVAAYSKYYNAASNALSDKQIAFSREPHNNMPWTPQYNTHNQNLYNT